MLRSSNATWGSEFDRLAFGSRSSSYVPSCSRPSPRRIPMKVAAAIAEILKREGVEFLIGYPVNPVIEAAAAADIRTIIVRQERVGLHMADAVSRLSSGKKIGVFALQHGPGAENAFGGIAQAYSESVPIIVLAGGIPATAEQLRPVLQRVPQLPAHHQVDRAADLRGCDGGRDAAGLQPGPDRPAPTRRRRDPGGRLPRGGRRAAELPADVPHALGAGSGGGARRRRDALVEATRPVIYAGQGVHYAQAWDRLRALAELLEAPVVTSLAGEERVPRDAPAVGRARPAAPSRRRSSTSCRTPT